MQMFTTLWWYKWCAGSRLLNYGGTKVVDAEVYYIMVGQLLPMEKFTKLCDKKKPFILFLYLSTISTVSTEGVGTLYKDLKTVTPRSRRM